MLFSNYIAGLGWIFFDTQSKQVITTESVEKQNTCRIQLSSIKEICKKIKRCHFTIFVVVLPCSGFIAVFY